jgi:DNA-binding response OmpR family regulator
VLLREHFVRTGGAACGSLQAAMPNRLLLVEDDPAIADTMRLHLAQAGLPLQHAADAPSGLAAIRSGAWDLVMLDLMLPGGNGLDLCRELRSTQPEVPVIMLSANGTESQRVLGLELGADDYLAKPFSMLELVARVRALLRRMARVRSVVAATAELRFGPFRLDTVRRELQRDGVGVALTLREFDLLVFLARHPGRAFGRGELLQRVWGEGFDGYEHTVNSHINRLRARVEDDPREPRRIVTVWGLGYRFEPDPAAP